MAVYSKSFTPVADLKRKRELEAQRKARLAPKGPPAAIMQAGAGLAAAGNIPGALARQGAALRRWQAGEEKRQADVASQLYKEEAQAKESGLARAADIEKQRVAGAQQAGVERFRAEQEAERQGERLAAQKELAELKVPRKATGDLTTKQIADLELGLRKEYFDKGRRGKELRKQYGTRTEGGLFGIGGDEVSGGGVDAYVREMMQRYIPGQEQTVSTPEDEESGVITKNGRIISARGYIPEELAKKSAEAYVDETVRGLPRATAPRQPMAKQGVNLPIAPLTRRGSVLGGQPGQDVQQQELFPVNYARQGLPRSNQMRVIPYRG